MSKSYLPPAPPGAAIVTIRTSDKTVLRVGPVPGRDRVWVQLTYAGTFVVAVLTVDQVARLIVGLRGAAGSAAGDLSPVQRGDGQYDRGDTVQGTGRPWRGPRYGEVIDDTGTLAGGVA